MTPSSVIEPDGLAGLHGIEESGNVTPMRAGFTRSWCWLYRAGWPGSRARVRRSVPRAAPEGSAVPACVRPSTLADLRIVGHRGRTIWGHVCGVIVLSPGCRRLLRDGHASSMRRELGKSNAVPALRLASQRPGTECKHRRKEVCSGCAMGVSQIRAGLSIRPKAWRF